MKGCQSWEGLMFLLWQLNFHIVYIILSCCHLSVVTTISLSFKSIYSLGWHFTYEQFVFCTQLNGLAVGIVDHGVFWKTCNVINQYQSILFMNNLCFVRFVHFGSPNLNYIFNSCSIPFIFWFQLVCLLYKFWTDE